MIDWTYHARSDLRSRISRRFKRWRVAAPVEIDCDRPIVTFTFDDFPKSAVAGADIVERHGGRAGFYACTIMAGQTGPYGEMFDASTLAELHGRGHEIGAHSHGHIDMSLADASEVVADIDANLAALKALGHDAPVTSFAYPFGEVRYEAQLEMTKRFKTCRGVAPGVNQGVADISHLRAIELCPEIKSFETAANAIESLKSTPGWLILFSHDVSTDPSQFGVSIRDLEELCKRATDAGAVLAAPTQAALLAGVMSECR